MAIVSESEVGTSGPLRRWLGNIEVPDERRERRDLFAELRGIGREIDDLRLACRLELASQSLRPRGSTSSTPRSTLSPREIDVPAQVALGTQNATIAPRLPLTKSYLSSAMRKLQAGSRYEAGSPPGGPGHSPRPAGQAVRR